MAKLTKTNNVVKVKAVKGGFVEFANGQTFSAVDVKAMSNPYGRGYAAHLADEKPKPKANK